jgi:hypothetical protein
MRSNLTLVGLTVATLLATNGCGLPEENLDPTLVDEEVDQTTQSILICPDGEPPPCHSEPGEDDPDPGPPRDPSVPRTPGLRTLAIDIGIVNLFLSRLDGTKISIDTTGHAPPIYSGSHQVCRRIDEEAYQEAVAECRRLPGAGRVPCIREANENFPVECYPVRNAYHSYISFPAEVKQEIPELADEPMDIDKFTKDTWYGDITISLNQIRTVFGQQPAELFAGGNGGPAFIGLRIGVTSNSPTIYCYRPGFLPCPDVRLGNMKLALTLRSLRPDPDDATRVTFGGVGVSFTFTRDVNNLPDWLVDAFYDLDAKIKDKVKKKLTAAIMKRQEGMTTLLTAIVNKYARTLDSRFPGFKRIDEITASSNIIYVHYEPNPN